ncbi:MAG: choice-of-anchor J domain-containing protein [Muribaculaceae bacterium]
MRRFLQSALLLLAVLIPFAASATRSMSISSTLCDDGISTFFYGSDLMCRDLRANVTITNTGDEDLNVGDEDYTFTINYYYSYSGWGTPTPTYTYGPFPIPEALAVGESKTFEFTVPEFNGYEVYNSSYGSAKRWNIVENVSGKSAQFAGTNITILPKANTTGTSLSSSTLYYNDENKISGLTVTVKFRNNTAEDMHVGDTDYTVDVFWYKSSSSYDNPDETITVATADIPQDCPAGQTISFTVDIPEFDVSPILALFDEGTTDMRTPFRTRENINGTFSIAWADIKPTIPEHSLVQETSNTLLFSTSAPTIKSYGFITEDQTLKFRMRTTGGAPVHVTSIDVPDGVTITPTEFTLPGLATAPATDDQYQLLTLTISADQPRVVNGLVTFHIEGADDDSFTVQAIVPDPTKLFEDFELPDGASLSTYIPQGWVTINGPEGNSKWEMEDISAYYAGGAKLKTNDNDKYAMKNSLVEYWQKLVTPRVHVNAGETMSFDALARTKGSNLSVWYSADRVNWTQAANIVYVDKESTEPTTDWAWEYSKTYSSDFVPERGTYVVDNIPEGDWYIAFQAGYAYINNVYGFTPNPATHDVIINSADIPAQSTINQALTVSLSATNLGATDEAEGTYSVKVYYDGKEIAAADTPAWTSGESLDFSATFYPHETGAHTVFAEIVVGDATIRTAETTVNLKPETASVELTIGTYSKTSSSVPHNLNYVSSESQILAKADYLAQYGLTEGAKIVGIKFPCYTSYDLIHNSRYKVAMKSTEQTALTTSTPIDFEDSDVKYLNDSYQLIYSSNSGANAPIYMTAATFDQPYVYDGGNLAILTQLVRHSDYKSATYLATGEITDGCLYRYKDTSQGEGDWDANYADLATESWGISSAAYPIFVLELDKTPASLDGTLYGGDNQPIPNQEIILTSVNGQAVYRGTTDENGQYHIEVFQPEWEYGATIDNPDNKWYCSRDEFSFTDGQSTASDIHLEGFSDTRDYCISISAVTNDGGSVAGKSFSLSSDRFELQYPTEETVFDENGKCVIFVYGGRHTLSINIDGYKPLTAKFSVNTEYHGVFSLEEDIVTPYGLTADINHNIYTGSNDVTITWNREQAVFADDFESYEPFALEFQPWSGIDADNSPAVALTGQYPNAALNNYGQIINPFAVSPMWDIKYNYTLAPHSGSQYVGFVQRANNSTGNDWIITPDIEVGDNNVLRFFARSADAGKSHIAVGISTAEEPTAADFTTISDGNYLSIGYEEWTPVTIDLSDYAGQTVKVGIHDVSPTGNIMAMIDDIFVGRINDAAQAIARRVAARSPQYPNETFIISLNGKDVATTDGYSFTIGNMQPGTHTIGVRAKFTTGESPEVTTSVTISKADYAAVNFGVTTNNNVTPDDIKVELMGEGNVYTLSVADGVAAAKSLPKGKYTASIEVPYFQPFVEEFDLADDYSTAIVLQETIVKPFNITADSEETELGIFDVTFNWNKDLGFTDSFEEYDDFATGSFGDWTTIDNNVEVSYPISLGGQIVNFPGASTLQAPASVPPMVFNPEATEPSMGEDPGVAAPTGKKTVIFMGPQYAKADKWLISPAINVREDYVWSVTAKSYDYYLETLELCISTTDTDPASFTVLDAVQPTHEMWTKYSLDLSEYAGQDVYLAVHCTSNDGFIVQIDDFTVSREDSSDTAAGYVIDYSVALDDAEAATTTETTFVANGVAEGEHTFRVTANYYSGSSDEATYVFGLTSGVADALSGIVKVQGLKGAISIDASADASIAIIDAAGRVLTAESITAGAHTFAANAGVYVVTVGTKAVKVLVK